MLIHKIREDSLAARKARETDKATLLVTLFAEASRAGKDDGNRDSTDEEAMKTVRKFIDGIDTSLAVLTYTALVAKAQAEKNLLLTYLPAQLSGDALRAVINEIVGTLKEKNAKAMGQVMGILRKQYAGTFNGDEAGKLAREALA